MADYAFPDSRIVLFAKAPVLGTVKTRMQPALTAQQSLQLHCELVSYCLQTAIQSRAAPVELWVSEHHRWWQQLSATVRLQVGDDLGERLYHAANTVLAEHHSVVMIGGDCPFITAEYLHQALTALHSGERCVIGPARDGGYVLMGLAACHQAVPLRDSVFSNIDWGQAQVLQQTQQRIAALGWCYHQLPFERDIEQPEDIESLAGLPAFKHWLSSCR